MLPVEGIPGRHFVCAECRTFFVAVYLPDLDVIVWEPEEAI